MLNTLQFNVGFENIAPNPRVDYALNTSLKTLKDNYAAQETDWQTTFNAYFRIIEEKFIALVNADANMAQRSDGEVDRRNLFRVEPSFKVNLNRFGGSIGYKAVNEFDAVKNKLIRDKSQDIYHNKKEIKELLENEIVSRYYFQKIKFLHKF